ncbi:hypothetical protein VPH35_002319 [Triticum aestivum]
MLLTGRRPRVEAQGRKRPRAAARGAFWERRPRRGAGGAGRAGLKYSRLRRHRARTHARGAGGCPKRVIHFLLLSRCVRHSVGPPVPLTGDFSPRGRSQGSVGACVASHGRREEDVRLRGGRQAQRRQGLLARHRRQGV